MFPDFFLAFPYLLFALATPAKALQIKTDEARVRYPLLLRNFGATLVPVVMTFASFWLFWWYVVIQPASHDQSASAGSSRSTRRQCSS